MEKSLKLLIAIFSIFLTITHISCNDDDNDAITECDFTNCTEEFVSIEVSIMDENQNPVALDAFKVIDIENGTDMTISLSPTQLEMAQQSGKYPLVNDSSLEVNQERKIQFKGFINNEEVISSDYTISKDCCHIELVSGNTQLSL